MSDEPADEPKTAAEWSRRTLAHHRLITAALALDDAFDLRRSFENAAVTREFVVACRAVRDLDRRGEIESDAD